MLRIGSSGSYSTSMSESASNAVSSSSAAIAATGSPTYRTLSTARAVSSCVEGMMPIFSGMSAPVQAQTTAGRTAHTGAAHDQKTGLTPSAQDNPQENTP